MGKIIHFKKKKEVGLSFPDLKMMGKIAKRPNSNISKAKWLKGIKRTIDSEIDYRESVVINDERRKQTLKIIHKMHNNVAVSI